MTFVVGVDGGGTRMRAVVVGAHGSELARGESAGAVATAHAPQKAAEAVALATRDAIHRAGIEVPVTSLWAGLAGAGDPAARRAVAEALEAMGLAGSVTVGTDVEAAFQSAFGDAAGVLLVAGTGSIAWSRAPDGEIRRIGGWGQHLGDEGSGFAIGLAGLRCLTRAHDGRATATALTAALLQACGLESPPDLVGWVSRASKADVAALAPYVVGIADEGDHAAAAIVATAVAELMELVDVAVEPAWARTSGGVALWGGMLAANGPLRGRVMDALSDRGIAAYDRPIDPPVGAARLALRSVTGRS